MNDEALEIRPQKEGYLKKQINSVLDIWNTRFFYLDGANFAYFFDEGYDRPRRVMNLKGCIIDGIWPKDNIYTFTIRSVTDDSNFLYLGAFSIAEAEDWVRKLKEATQYIEYSEIIAMMNENAQDAGVPGQQDEEQDHLMEGEEGTGDLNDNEGGEGLVNTTKDVGEEPNVWNISTAEAQELMPATLKTAFDDFLDVLTNKTKQFWLLKKENDMGVYINEEDSKYITFHSTVIIKDEFTKVIKVFESDLWEDCWNPYLKNIHVAKKLDERVVLYNAEYEIKYADYAVAVRSNYMSQRWRSGDTFTCIRAKVGKTKGRWRQNLLSLDAEMDMFGLQLTKLNASYPATSLTLVAKTKKRFWIANKVMKKFYKKYFIMFSILATDLDHILKKIYGVALEEREENLVISPQMSSHIAKVPAHPLPKRLTSVRISNTNHTIVIPQTEKDPYKRKKEDILTEKWQFDRFHELDGRFKVKGINLHEDIICRFLVAKELNVKEAESSLQQFLKWKKDTELDTTTLEDPRFDLYIKQQIITTLGFDRTGRPVVYFASARYLPKQTPEDNFALFTAVYLQKVIESFTKGVWQYMIIVDMKDAGSDNVSLGFLKQMIPLFQNNYPGYLAKLIVINASIFIKGVYLSCKPFLHPKTVAKIDVISEEKAKIHEHLSKYLDDEVIPVAYGGTRVL